MDNNNFSALEDNEKYKNKKFLSNKTNKYLLYLPQIKKIPSFVSEKAEKTAVPLKVQMKNSSNNDLFKIPQYIKNQVRQYELHPHRQYNLKIINEDIKNKLYEMHKKNINNTTVTLPNESILQTKKKENLTLTITHKNLPEKKTSPKNLHEKRLSNKSFVSNHKSSKLNLLKIDEIPKNEKKENNDVKKIILEIPQNHKIKKKKKNKKEKLNDNSRLLIRYRKISRIKNLYDSNADDESGEDEDDYVIDPETNFIAILDSLIIIFFVFYFIKTTISLSIEKCFCSSNNHFSFSDILLIINDFLCFFDLIISFFRGYYSYDYKLVKLNKLILKNYLKNDFSIDLLSAIPIFSITKYICINQNEGNYYEKCFKYEMPNRFLFLKLGSLLKAVKCIKILGHKKNMALERLIEYVSDNYAIERTIVILIYSLKYIGIFHFFVCLHIFVANHSYSNWLILTESQNEPFSHIYISSLYFIITTLTTVGYGDIVCQSLLERIYQIILLAIGSVFYPYVVSMIGNFIKNNSNAKIKKQNNLEMLENIRMTYPNIPFKLYNKIYKYLESKGTSMEKHDANLLIESLPFTLKNNILFTMYKSAITNFKFFKNNNNSVFIAEVLNNFIPCVSKKNEFLVYEGEMLEEIIFLKDGKISLNAAINSENPMNSINKYFYESFSPFTTEEERKILNENMNTKSHISAFGEMNFDRAKLKLNNAFKNFRNDRIGEDKSQFEIHTNFKSENFDFDVKGGAIINDEGNYQYLKILDIRKNEHFGCVFMTLNRPCPLSLQVKSKIAELFLLKKEQAVNLSKSYPNIWRKIYGREFHNLRTIKKYTFAVLKKYIDINELMFNNGLNDLKTTNNISAFDLNFLEKSAFGEKSIKKSAIRKTVSQKKNEINKNNTLNFECDKKSKKLNLDVIRVNIQSKIKKKHFEVRRNSTCDERDIAQISNNFLNLSNPNAQNIKASNLSNQNFNKSGVFKNNGDSSFNNTPPKINLINYFRSSRKKNNPQKTKKEKLKNLKFFLIECKKIFMNSKSRFSCESNNNEDKNNNVSNQKDKIKKSCFKQKSPDNFKNRLNLVKNIPKSTHSNKSVEFDISSNKDKENNTSTNKKYRLNDKLLNDLKDICEEETDFSFCSTNEDNLNKSKELYIERNTFFEINSSYQNLNKISKGKYIKDKNFQNKLKIIFQNYYKYKNNFKNKESSDLNDTLLLKTIAYSTELEPSNLNMTEYRTEKFKTKSKKSEKFKYKNNTFCDTDKNKKYKTTKITNKMANKTEIGNKNSIISNKLSLADIEFKDNTEVYPTYKLQNSFLSEEQSSDNSDKGSVVVNKSNTSSFSKKSGKDESESISNKNTFGINIKKDVNIFNNKEIEYVIDNMNKNKKVNFSIYKNKNSRRNILKNNKPKFSNKNNELINQMLGIQIPDSNLINNNIITTTSKMKDNKNDFNSVENIKNIENLSIYNIIQKNINKNLNIIDNKEKDNKGNYGKSYCCII